MAKKTDIPARALDAELNLTWLRQQVERAAIETRWDRMALSALEDELSEALQRLTVAAIGAGVGRGDQTGETVPQARRWIGANLAAVDRYRRLLDELESTERPDLAMLNVAVGVVGKLLPRTVVNAA